jgi:membrane protein
MTQGVSRGWRFCRAVVLRFYKNQGWFSASGIAFQAFFSLCPLLLLTASLVGYLYSDETAMTSTLSIFSGYLPASTLLLLDQALKGLVYERATLGITGVVALLWTGRSLFMALELSLERTWNLSHCRPGWRSQLVAICSTLALAAMTLSLMLASTIFSSLQAFMSRFPVPHIAGWTLDEAAFWSALQSWLIIPAATFFAFCIVYASVPYRTLRWRQVYQGALFASVGWRLTSWLYIQVIWEFGSKNPLYGSLWSVVGMLLWLYLESCVFLLGAEIIYASGRLESPKPCQVEKRTPFC